MITSSELTRWRVQAVQVKKRQRDMEAIDGAGAFPFDVGLATGELVLPPRLARRWGIENRRQGVTGWQAFLARVAAADRERLLRALGMAESSTQIALPGLRIRESGDRHECYEMRARIVERRRQLRLCGLLIPSDPTGLSTVRSQGDEAVDPGKADCLIAAVDVLPCAWYFLDGEGRIIHANPATRRMFPGAGCAEGASFLMEIQRNLCRFANPQELLNEVTAALAHRRQVQIDIELTDHRRIRIESVFLDGMKGSCWSFQDQQQWAKAGTKPESLERFQRMVDSLPNMIWISGADRSCVYFNRRWLEFTGRSMQEELGQGWTAGLHPQDSSAIRDFEQAYTNRIPYTRECRLLRFDGQYRYVRIQGMPWLDEKGEFAGFISSCEDITETKAAKEQVESKRQQLARANRASTIGEMATSLAHELNQPLAAIKAYATGCRNILANETSDIAQRLEKPLGHISMQAARAAEIMRSLRALVGRRSSRHDSQNVVELVNGMLPLFEMEWPAEYSVTIEHWHDDDLPEVTCDPVLIQQVLLNLLRNSVEAVGESYNRQPRIIIKTRQVSDDKICIAVSDSGPGMSEVVRKRALNPFFSTKADGMGMGLAICQTIIEEHGGSLSIDCSSLGGAEVSFSLPINS